MQENQGKWVSLVLIIIYVFPACTLCTAVLRNPMSFKFYRNWAFQSPYTEQQAVISTARAPVPSLTDTISSAEHVLSGRTQTQPWK